jgi:hypothetical protein
MIQRCTCTEPFAVNSTGPKETAGLIVSDLYCDRCGWGLDNDDRRIPLIQRVGLEHWRHYALQERDWATLEKLIFRTPPELPLEGWKRQQWWLALSGMALSLAMLALAVTGILGWGSPLLRLFLTGAGVGALGVQIWFTIRQNRRLRRLRERLG